MTPKQVDSQILKVSSLLFDWVQENTVKFKQLKNYIFVG